MKFVVAVVMLALAVSVNASLYTAQLAPAVSLVTSHGPGLGGPWGGPWGGAWGHGAGPAAISIDHGWGHSGAGWGPSGAAWGHGGAGWGHSAPGLWGGIPGISLSQGPIGLGGHLALPVHAAAPHGHEGVYVAKTRGAIHTAPLAGHVNSATSLNLAAAPGTH